MVQLDLFLAHQTLPIPTLIDSGCSGHAFLDRTFAQRHGLTTYLLPRPRELRLADGIASDTITEYTILPMSISGHNEYGLFFITRLAANTPAILGLPWLQKHNPSIDWANMQLKFDKWRCTGYCNPSGVVITAPGLRNRPQTMAARTATKCAVKSRLLTIKEDPEEEEPHRTSNYQMPSKEGCTADLPLQLPYASTNYQAPSVEECTEKQTLQTPADQELYVPQTLTPGRPHYQTYDASAANGGPEVRARMIPSQKRSPRPIQAHAGQRHKAKPPAKGVLPPLSVPIPPSYTPPRQPTINFEEEDIKYTLATGFVQFCKQEGVTMTKVTWNELDRAFANAQTKELDIPERAFESPTTPTPPLGRRH
ncbi:reverse transcriptase [Pyrenophora tritici-repentis]|nr:reverse transcriptase [Pyrenophora tritici-repentis]